MTCKLTNVPEVVKPKNCMILSVNLGFPQKNGVSDFSGRGVKLNLIKKSSRRQNQ